MVRIIDGKKVRACRKRLGWSQLDLCRRTGMCPEAIRNIEDGQAHDPDRETMVLLSKTLLVDIEDIE